MGTDALRELVEREALEANRAGPHLRDDARGRARRAELAHAEGAR